jgi:hypothetical protein
MTLSATSRPCAPLAADDPRQQHLAALQPPLAPLISVAYRMAKADTQERGLPICHRRFSLADCGPAKLD